VNLITQRAEGKGPIANQLKDSFGYSNPLVHREATIPKFTGQTFYRHHFVAQALEKKTMVLFVGSKSTAALPRCNM
jgi:hypothetical protein